jgi:hypothetical protein
MTTPSLVYRQGVVWRGPKVTESFSEYGKSTPEKILHRAWRNAGLNQATVKGRDGHLYKLLTVESLQDHLGQISLTR